MAFFFDTDMNCRWYRIPLELKHKWAAMTANDLVTEVEVDLFEKTFGSYHCDHPSSIPVEMPDDALFDTTDWAHPAWWRGTDHGILVISGRLLEAAGLTHEGLSVTDKLELLTYIMVNHAHMQEVTHGNILH